VDLGRRQVLPPRGHHHRGLVARGQPRQRPGHSSESRFNNAFRLACVDLRSGGPADCNHCPLPFISYAVYRKGLAQRWASYADL
jgi:hypothetical protein